MRYKFSETTVAEFYGIKFYSITNAKGRLVAYSQKVWEIPDEVNLMGQYKCLIFEKSLIMGGEIWGGVIWGGIIRGGEIRGGEIWGGVIRGGEINGGVINGGVIRGGEINGGVINGGVIRGGEINGGVINGGVINGGVINGGVIRGGEIRGGVYESSLLQIQGTRHYCYATPTDDGGIELGIGCHIHTIDFWIDNFKSIGESEEYSKSEIAEYKQYIDLYAIRYGNN